MKYLRIVAGVLFALLLLMAATLKLESTPPLWWDEGWTLSVARNWVEKGHYSRLLGGKPTSPGLEATFPVTAPVALSFRVMGVGIWQGRVIGLIYVLGVLLIVYFLARRLYNRPVALATLGVVVFMSPKADLHPILMGRQVLAEMPMLFYLLSGYCFLLLTIQKSKSLLFAAILVWSVALVAKLQAVPFWFLSLVIPLWIAIYRKSWSVAGLLLAALVGSALVAAAIFWGAFVLINPEFPRNTVSGLFGVTALVNLPDDERIKVLAGLSFVLPTIVGLAYATRVFRGTHLTSPNAISVVHCALWILTASWIAWYAFFSVGWDRYLFPAVFIGSIFVAAMLYDLTDHFSLASTVKRGSECLKRFRLNRENCGALLAIVLVTFAFAVTVKTFYQSYFVEADQSVLEVANFLNTQTPEDALIETYDSELFFLLNRRYHYPPDQIHVDLIRRTSLEHDVPINYDPLAADPDYLVVGFHSNMWRLYEPVLNTGAFRPVGIYRRYYVFQRVR